MFQALGRRWLKRVPGQKLWYEAAAAEAAAAVRAEGRGAEQEGKRGQLSDGSTSPSPPSRPPEWVRERTDLGGGSKHLVNPARIEF